jgi:SAM-dependent methyltransferase
MALADSQDDLAGALRETVRIKLDGRGIGWSPRMRQRFDYFTPDEWYEALLSRLVTDGTDWLDVGCGRDLFPSNPRLAEMLAARCRLLVGIDPDDNIQANPLLHERAQCLLQDFRTDRRFDLITLRMVVEHITDPEGAVASLDRLIRPGGRVVVYTVSKWSPAALAAALTPMAVHHAAKKALWMTAPEDTFPTAYRMNTRGRLARLFAAADFAEERFLALNDCRAFARWQATAFVEHALERLLRAVGIGYPEMCLLGIYRKSPAV